MRTDYELMNCDFLAAFICNYIANEACVVHNCDAQPHLEESLRYTQILMENYLQ